MNSEGRRSVGPELPKRVDVYVRTPLFVNYICMQT